MNGNMLKGRSPCGSPGSCHLPPSKHDLTATFLILNRQFGRYSPEPDGLISIKLSPDFPVIRRILACSSSSDSPQAEDSCYGHQRSVCPRRRLSANGSACSAAAALSALLPPTEARLLHHFYTSRRGVRLGSGSTPAANSGV